MKTQIIYFFRMLILVGIIGFNSCDSNIMYENYTDFRENKWYADSVVRFSFDVVDASKSYNLYYNVRHTLAYPYYNLYVQYQLHPEKTKGTWQRKDGNLLHPTTGVPLGQGTSDLYNCRFPIFENYKFDKAGKYIFEIQQDMRLDTLPEISAVGFRVEIAESK